MLPPAVLYCRSCLVIVVASSATGSSYSSPFFLPLLDRLVNPSPSLGGKVTSRLSNWVVKFLVLVNPDAFTEAKFVFPSEQCNLWSSASFPSSLLALVH